RFSRDWSSDVCSSDLEVPQQVVEFLGLVFGVAEDAHAVALLPGFVHEFGGVEVAGGGGVLGEDVEPVALVFIVPAGGAGSWAAEIGRASCRVRGETSG